MAAYRNTDIIIRTFKVPLRQTVKTQADYDWIDAYQTGLEGEVNACLRNDELMRQAMMLDIKSKGKFDKMSDVRLPIFSPNTIMTSARKKSSTRYMTVCMMQICTRLCSKSKTSLRRRVRCLCHSRRAA